jgi:hypothetical protein
VTNSNETDFFDGVGGGAGAPSPVLKNVGDYVHGTIVEMFKRPYIPFGKKEVEKWTDGPKAGEDKQQLVIILQTQHRNWENVNKVPKSDPSDATSAEKPASDDDGKRAVFVPEGKNIQFAIGRAATSAQSKPAVGGVLGVKITELRDTGKGNDLKIHEAVYTPPQASDGFFPERQAAPATPAPQAAPAPVQEAAPAPQAAPAAPTQDPWASSAPAPSDPPF